MTQQQLFNCEESDLMACPECNRVMSILGESPDYHEANVMGACDGCVFCPHCSTEIESDTGKMHEPCKECNTQESEKA